MNNPPLKTVITYGTFDLFHVGHVRLLNRLKAMGDRLVVGLSTDDFNRRKGKTALMSYADREEVLKACRYVDLVIPEDAWEQKARDIKEHNVCIFGIGDDWLGKFDDLRALCAVVYLPRTHGISSTAIKSLISGLHKQNIEEMKKSIDSIASLLETFGNE